jgi:hypothetical protein
MSSASEPGSPPKVWLRFSATAALVASRMGGDIRTAERYVRQWAQEGRVPSRPDFVGEPTKLLMPGTTVPTERSLLRRDSLVDALDSLLEISPYNAPKNTDLRVDVPRLSAEGARARKSWRCRGWRDARSRARPNLY